MCSSRYPLPATWRLLLRPQAGNCLIERHQRRDIGLQLKAAATVVPTLPPQLIDSVPITVRWFPPWHHLVSPYRRATKWNAFRRYQTFWPNIDDATRFVRACSGRLFGLVDCIFSLNKLLVLTRIDSDFGYARLANMWKFR